MLELCHEPQSEALPWDLLRDPYAQAELKSWLNLALHILQSRDLFCRLIIAKQRGLCEVSGLILQKVPPD
jgi:hypothetical protein